MFLLKKENCVRSDYFQTARCVYFHFLITWILSPHILKYFSVSKFNWMIVIIYEYIDNQM